MYAKSDVDAAERAIREAVPDAHVERTDYGWSLSAARADRTMAFVVFQVERRDRGQPEIKKDVQAVISALRL